MNINQPELLTWHKVPQEHSIIANGVKHRYEISKAGKGFALVSTDVETPVYAGDDVDRLKVIANDLERKSAV